MSELVERYRTYALECVKIAQNVSSSQEKMALLEMAQGFPMKHQLAEHKSARLVRC